MAKQIKRPVTAFSKDRPKRATRGHKALKLDDHRRWINSLPSLITGRYGTVECAHINQPDASAGKSYRGKSTRADDIYCVPLSKELHIELDTGIGWKAFQLKYNIDLVKVAQSLYLCHGDEEDAEIIIGETVTQAAENVEPKQQH